MQKILIVMDDVNYRGGAHYATFKIANFLASVGNYVNIYSPFKVTMETKYNLDSNVGFLDKEDYSGYDYIIIPFENSIFREKISKLKGIIKIQWIHNDYERWKDIVNIDLKKEKEIFKGIDRIIFVSEYIKNGFLRLFPEFEDKCSIIYNLIDTSNILSLGEEAIDEEIFEKDDEEQLNIVVAGRLEPQKAYHRLIDVVKILNEKKLKIKWIIMGEGYEYDELKARCKKYSIKNIHFIGFRKNPYPYIKKTDIFALLSEYEGFGLVIAESLTLGVPVLATDSGVVSEVLSEDYGWIVDNNIYSIIDSINNLYEKREEIKLKKDSLNSYLYDNSIIREKIKEMFNLRHENPSVSMLQNSSKANDKTVPIVSVIVPVYNMELYLAQCLDSLVKQTLHDIEILIINDGSTDGSQDIINDYVYKYSNKIRAFTIVNSGLGEARNFGISKAKGTYLGFVDSDDFIKCNMFEIMLDSAKKYNADCIISDYIAIWDNGREEYITSIPSKVQDRFEILKYSTKYGVVNACTKLIHRDLFQHAKFPKGFYEDLATMPIILSYAKNIYYVQQGLYYYRQRIDSITSVKKNDTRLLDCYVAWDRIKSLANPLYINEVSYAIYWSMDFFCTNFLTDFTMYSKNYFEMNRSFFSQNTYISNAIENQELMDFNSLPHIPKIIHYCWFGKNLKNDLILSCIESWRKFAPGFEIIEWNEDNCNLYENKYVEKAYNNKEWAFVSDYFRLKALYEYGGIYLDTDMELMKPIEPYLYNTAFFAFETPIFVHAGIIGAIKNSDIINNICQTYINDKFTIGKDNIPETIPRRITKILENETNLVKNGKTQILNNGIKIYSANIMTIDFHDGNCVANHHYEGNWLNKDNQTSYNYSYEVMKHYFTWDSERSRNNNFYNENLLEVTNLDYKLLYNQIISSTSWKITKPLRLIVDLVKRIKQ